MRLLLCTAILAVVTATAGCRPDVWIAESERESGSSGGSSDLPSGGDEGGMPVTEPARLLADSVADFSLTQGERGWSYGYDSGSLDTFTLMTRKSVVTNYVPPSNDVWDCWANDTVHWTQIFQLGGHPNGTDTTTPSTAILQRAVRRWTSTFAGEVTISGEIAKIDTIGSNGVDAFVYVDGTQLYTTFIAGDDSAGRIYEVVAALRVGSTVDFVLDPHDGADHHDLSRFTGIVVRVEQGAAP
jgi:hypothetical protein